MQWLPGATEGVKKEMVLKEREKERVRERKEEFNKEKIITAQTL